MKLLLAFLLFLTAFWGDAQPTGRPQSVYESMLRTSLRNNELAPGGHLAPTSPTDTVVARQFLEAVADTLLSDSVVVARFMCADVLLRKHEPHVDTAAALLRESLYFLRVSLLRSLPKVRRSRFVSFRDLPQKPPFELVGGAEGAYVLLEGEQPKLYLLVRESRVVSFALSFYEGPHRAHFRDYCRWQYGL